MVPPDMLDSLVMGLVYGVIHVIGPDHLGTLITLSSVMSHGRAFRVGAAWGLGHSFGMVLIGAVFVLTHRMVHTNIEHWEYIGNYVIGASMVLCALYFIVRESSFLEQQSDGTFLARPCACHAPPVTTAPTCFSCTEPGAECASEGEKKWCSGFKSAAQRAPPAPDRLLPEDPQDPEDEERAPLLPGSGQSGAAEPTKTWWERAWSRRDVKCAILAVLQGVCCPVGLVGISFLANLSIPGTVTFLVVFLTVSAFGTAFLAMCWAYFTTNWAGSTVSTRTVYRCSCGFTMALGFTWIALNFSGTLGRIDYTEQLHHR